MTNLTKTLIETTFNSLNTELSLATAETVSDQSREYHWAAAEMESRTLASMIATRNQEQQNLI